MKQHSEGINNISKEQAHEVMLSSAEKDCLENTLFDIRSHQTPAKYHIESPRQELRILGREGDSEFCENIGRNLTLLSLSNGHRGSAVRAVLENPMSPEARFMQSLRNWASQVVASDEIAFSSTLEGRTPEFLSSVKTGDDLYERLQFIERYPYTIEETYRLESAAATARAVGEKSDSPKWIDLVDPVFRSRNPSETINHLLDSVGFIPEELYTKRKFKNIPVASLFAMEDVLRDIDGGAFKEQAAYERAKILNYIIIGGNANEARRGVRQQNITLDTNGIFINLRNFHAHLPYGLIREDTFSALARDHWIRPEELIEVRLKNREANSLVEEYRRECERQIEQFAQAWRSNEGYALDVSISTARIADALIADPEEFARKLFSGEHIIPDALIHELIIRKDAKSHFAIMMAAERIEAELTRRILGAESRDFWSHDILHAAESAYDIQSKILNRPEYYNALKIVRMLLSHAPGSLPEKRFGIFRGAYKKTREGEQHAFIEGFSEGHTARVLLNEDKHIGRAEQAGLQSIPLFDRPTYDMLETALQSFNYYSKIVQELEGLGQSIGNEFERFNSLSFTALHFILTNVTRFYPDAAECYRAFTTASSDEEKATYAQELILLFGKAKDIYADFLYDNTSSGTRLAENTSPEIKTSDLSYGENFLAQVREHVAKDGYDESLCRESLPTRVALLSYHEADPTETVPYYIEESCLDAIRLDRDRPFINVIGGCRFVEGGKENPLGIMGGAVMKAAHDYKVNVGVPGTQSGIGVVFGRQNIEYRKIFDHLPKSEQAHLFAISPGGNTFFPGNPYTQETPSQEVFAISPVDSIITPFDAGWHLQGRDRLNSPYRKHVAHMEALYKRVSYEQPQIMIVGNGGLYSIMEINESLSHDFDLMLISDSGRFAEAASVLMEHTGEINAIEERSAKAERIFEIFRIFLDPQVQEEFLKKDFGRESEPESENYEVFRIFFFDFLTIAGSRKDKIIISDLDSLSANLDAYLSRKRS